MSVSNYKTTDFKEGDEVTFVKEHAIKLINVNFALKENTLSFQDLIDSADLEDRFKMLDMQQRIFQLIKNYDLLKDYIQIGIVTSTNDRGVFVKYYSEIISDYQSTSNLTNPFDLIHGHLTPLNENEIF